MTQAKVLIVEDSASLALGYAAQLQDAGHDVSLCETLAKAQQEVKAQSFDVVLLDLQLPDGDGLAILESLPDAGGPSVVVVTADGSLSRAIAAMRLGAYDFLVKPVSGNRLLSTVTNAAEQAGLVASAEPEPVVSKSRPKGFHGFIGQSVSMMAVYRTIESVANSRATVFVTGESGTGKEVAAEAIHAESKRRSGPFVAINCGAIPENLLESELFGHVKGAFTGAVENRIGAAKAADGGTLFLDEICEMDLKLQVKLLRFLQERVIERIGGRKPISVDTRIVCATHQNLEEMITEGSFRDDLYYRLAEIVVKIPTLAERSGDAALLAKHFLKRYADEMNPSVKGLAPDALAALDAWAWPGNVRELENRMKRAVIMADEKLITAADLDLADKDEDGPELLNLKAAREIADRKAIRRAIARTQGNISNAAKLLGISRPTLYDLIKQYELQT